MGFLDTLVSAKSGDSRAESLLFERWRSLLTFQATKSLGPDMLSRLDAADVVQDSLVQAVRELDAFDGKDEAQWIRWLQCLVAGHANKARRFHTAKKRDVDRDAVATVTLEAGNTISPQKELERVEDAGRTARALEKMPVEMKTALVHRVFLQRSWREIADELGKTEGAARVLWTRGLRKLREELENDD